MKIKIFIILLFLSASTFANPSRQIPDTLKHLTNIHEILNKKNDIYLLCEIWGFLKYHHPYITSGKIDWDDALLSFLPIYIENKNITQRNQLIKQWINNLGPIEKFNSKVESIPWDLKIKPNYNWINESGLTVEIINVLENLKNNHSEENQFYLKFIPQEDIVLPIFSNEKSYSEISNISNEYKLLCVFRYWNIIEYWYPYKYLTKDPWEILLKQFIKKILLTKTDKQYNLAVQKMVAMIKDSHAVVNSNLIENNRGKFELPFTIKFLENKAVISSVNTSILSGSGIEVGNILKSINGIKVKKMVDRIKPLVSASNEAVLYREVAKLLTRTNDTSLNVVIIDQNHNEHSSRLKTIQYALHKAYDFSYQKDSSYYLLNQDILYVNIGNIKRSQIENLKPFLKTVKSIILDNRQYPKNPSGDLICNLLLPKKVEINRFSTLERGFPGYFILKKPLVIGSENSDYFKGKVIILVNQETQSTGEYLSMAFKACPNSTVVGSTTAGTDGNVSLPFSLPGNIYTQITSLGVYYPDGTETQQIGIIPDIRINQSIAGLRRNEDEILLKAISITYLEK